ncbi:hypothetical protein CPB86DRAFT_820476 [Serendipita vermifera]|nr:hypothetical protein CPB86DRAFT_820476 [Serendipita vermifera]
MNIAATGERRYDPALDDDGGGSGHYSTYEFRNRGTMRSFIRPGFAEVGGSAVQQYDYQLPFGSMQVQASHVDLPVQPDPLVSSNPFPSDFSVLPIPENDVTTYTSFFPSPYVNNNTDFVAPFHAPQASNYDQSPGYSPLVSSGPQPTNCLDLQHIRYQFVSSPPELEGACYPSSAYTTAAPQFPSSCASNISETNTRTSHSTSLRFLSPLHFPTFGGDGTENSEYSDSSPMKRGCDPNPTELPESSQRFHNYRQLDDVQPSQALTMSLGFCESSEDSSRINRPIHPSSQTSSSSMWSVTDASANKNVNRRRGRHLGLGEIPACAIPWHVENPKKVSEQLAIRNTAGTIPQIVYDSFYETISNKKCCRYCSWTVPIERRSRIKQHVHVHLGYKPLTCSICQKAYNRKEDHQSHKFMP